MKKTVLILSAIVAIETMGIMFSWAFTERRPSKVEAAASCDDSASRAAVATLEGLGNGFRDAKRSGLEVTWAFVFDVIDESKKRLDAMK